MGVGGLEQDTSEASFISSDGKGVSITGGGDGKKAPPHLPISSHRVKPSAWARGHRGPPGAHKSQSPSGLAPGFITYQAFWARKRLNKMWFSSANRLHLFQGNTRESPLGVHSPPPAWPRPSAPSPWSAALDWGRRLPWRRPQFPEVSGAGGGEAGSAGCSEWEPRGAG